MRERVKRVPPHTTHRAQGDGDGDGEVDLDFPLPCRPNSSLSFPAAAPDDSLAWSPLFQLPSTSDHRFALPSPTTPERVVTGVVWIATAGSEKRMRRRVVSSLRARARGVGVPGRLMLGVDAEAEAAGAMVIFGGRAPIPIPNAFCPFGESPPPPPNRFADGGADTTPPPLPPPLSTPTSSSSLSSNTKL